MRLGIFAKTFSLEGPPAILSQIKKAGYQTAQWNWACAGLPSMPDEIEGGLCTEVTLAAQEAGVGITAVSGTYNMAHPDAEVRRVGAKSLAGIIDTAPLIGATMVTLCTGTRDANDQWAFHPENDSSDAWADLRESMVPAIEAAEKANVYLGIEPELGNVVSSAMHARKLMDEMKSDRLRIVIDPANLFEVAPKQEQRDLVAHAIDLLGDEIEMAHAKDRDPSGGFVAAGMGVLDYKHYFGCLKSIGFDGDLVTHGLSASEAAGVAEFLAEHLRNGANDAPV